MVKVDALHAVEGEGAMYVQIQDGEVRDVRLRIYEPPRFFEAFLRGRAYTEPPDITARICGICPVAYQMSACLRDRGRVRRHRRRTAAASCVASCTAANGSRATRSTSICCTRPTSSATTSAIAMAADMREVVERGLGLKKTGNDILELVGGRAIHPVNVRVGGFYRAPAPARARPARRTAAAGARRRDRDR